MTHLVYQPHPTSAPHFFLWGEGPSRVPAIGRLASLGRPATAAAVTERLRAERVSGRAIPFLDGVATLATLDACDLDRVPASVAGWSLAAKLALDLIARERMVPLVRSDRTGAEARWGVSLSLPDDAERLSHLARVLPPAAYAAPVGNGASRPIIRNGSGVGVWAPEALLTEFLDAVADAMARRASGRIALAGEGLTWEGRLIEALTGADANFAVDGFLERALPDELREWTAPARGAQAAPRRTDRAGRWGAKEEAGRQGTAFACSHQARDVGCYRLVVRCSPEADRLRIVALR